jgi:uncharacterized membrane protein
MKDHPLPYNLFAGQKIARVEALCDGVFAIAMTLLVLDIRVPISDAIKTEHDLFESLHTITPTLVSYFTSFMTLGIFWTGHAAQYSRLEKSDRNLNWISIFFLMVVALLPFTTAFMNAHIHFRLSIGLYWLNIFLLGLLLFINLVYARKKDYISGDADEKYQFYRSVRNRIIIAQVLYAVGALLCFINIYLSIAVIICIQLNYALAIIPTKAAKR